MASTPLQELKITISGPTPSKKNQRISLVIKGRAINIPSNKYREWHKGAVQEMGLLGKVETILKCHNVTLTFYSKDKRAFDISNKAESIMDLFVDCEIITDDNFNVVPRLTLVYGGIDKLNPRCEAVLEYVI